MIIKYDANLLMFVTFEFMVTYLLIAAGYFVYTVYKSPGKKDISFLLLVLAYLFLFSLCVKAGLDMWELLQAGWAKQ